MHQLVSIIIPVFNAEKWLAEAINSCLEQTYPAIEIIVIDDGSTDNSLNIIKNYGNKIRWESGENRGGNCARNRGFAVSKGEYIQFLDADDYLLPEKIARQMCFLTATDADVVYGDWRHQRHFPDGTVALEDIQISGKQSDILASLLADWWVSPACLLFHRTAVENSGGWDESLKAGQDRDFFISVVMSDAKIFYQPGCYSVYRRGHGLTISTASKTTYLENHEFILKKVEGKLLQQGNLSSKYRCALAESYFRLARMYLETDPAMYAKFLDKTLILCPKFRAARVNRTGIFILAQTIFGFRHPEAVVFLIKQTKKWIHQRLLIKAFDNHKFPGF